MFALAPTCSSKLRLDWHGPMVFWAEDVGSLPRALGGVYVLAAHVPSRPALVPFYVGQSANVRRRLFEHLGGQRTFARHLRNRLSTYFWVARVSGPNLRTAVEASLIRALCPAGNSNIPAARQLALNLPVLSLFAP